MEGYMGQPETMAPQEDDGWVTICQVVYSGEAEQYLLGGVGIGQLGCTIRRIRLQRRNPLHLVGLVAAYFSTMLRRFDE